MSHDHDQPGWCTCSKHNAQQVKVVNRHMTTAALTSTAAGCSACRVRALARGVSEQGELTPCTMLFIDIWKLTSTCGCMTIEKSKHGMHSECDYPHKSCLCTFWPCHPYIILYTFCIAENFRMVQIFVYFICSMQK